jgi:peptidoglycan/xylan/chitin deacetylase (PgdA/CDA1 family)
MIACAAEMNAWPILVSTAAATGAAVASWAAVHPTSEIFGPAVHHTPRASSIALTFDDGPNPACTPQLLALLERHRVPATFFLVGRFARNCPDLVREIAGRAHALGNHTQTHPNLVWMLPWRIADELKLCQESIFRALGDDEALPVCMRPPFGYRGPQLWSAVRSAGLRAVAMWSLTSYDWRHRSAPRLIERLGVVAKRSRAVSGPEIVPNSNNEQQDTSRGQIVLLHDGDFRHFGAERPHVLAALEFWLPRWRDAGLNFVTIDQLLAPDQKSRST